jgi:RHS repeat-associated protein
VRIVFNASGTVLSRQDYDPFGREILSAWGLPPEGFVGQTSDTESQQAYFHARQLQDRIGRFAAPDPISSDPSNPQGWNRYTYARNNPFRFIDPSGLSPKTGKDGQGFDCGRILAISPNDFWCNPPQTASPLFTGFHIPVDRGGATGGHGSGDHSGGTGGTGGDSTGGDVVYNFGYTDSTTVDGDAPLTPSVKGCGAGVFGYAGVYTPRTVPLGGELIAVVQYDSEEGGSHGGIYGLDLGNQLVAGVEAMRTWSDWQEHLTPIGIQNFELSSSRTFGKHIEPGSVDAGVLLTTDGPGRVSIGGYAGFGVLGGGAYMTLTAGSC